MKDLGFLSRLNHMCDAIVYLLYICGVVCGVAPLSPHFYIVLAESLSACVSPTSSASVQAIQQNSMSMFLLSFWFLATSSPLHPCLPSLPPAIPHTHTHSVCTGSNYLQTIFWHTTFVHPLLIAYKCYPNQIRLIKNSCKATRMLSSWFRPWMIYLWAACTAKDTRTRSHTHEHFWVTDLTSSLCHRPEVL